MYLLLLGTTALSLVTTPVLFKLIPAVMHLGVLMHWFPQDTLPLPEVSLSLSLSLTIHCVHTLDLFLHTRPLYYENILDGQKIQMWTRRNICLLIIYRKQETKKIRSPKGLYIRCWFWEFLFVQVFFLVLQEKTSVIETHSKMTEQQRDRVL